MKFEDIDPFFVDYISNITPKISETKCEEYAKMCELCKDLKEKYSELNIKIYTTQVE